MACFDLVSNPCEGLDRDARVPLEELLKHAMRLAKGSSVPVPSAYGGAFLAIPGTATKGAQNVPFRAAQRRAT